MIAIKGMEEIPKNCVECNHMDLQQAINCQLIYSGCANCGRHPDCPLVEIVLCKDCKHRIGCKCTLLNLLVDDSGFCADAERRE